MFMEAIQAEMVPSLVAVTPVASMLTSPLLGADPLFVAQSLCH